MRAARIREVLGLPPGDVLLVLEHPGGRTLRLRLSADADAPRFHLQSERVARHSGPRGPFFRRLSEEIQGGTLAGFAPVRADRIAILEVRDSPAGERRAIVIELFGRRANLALLGPGDRVLEVLVPPPAGKEKPRLAAGETYRPPEGRTGKESGSLLDSFPADAAPPEDWPAPLSWRVEHALGAQATGARRARELRELCERIQRRLGRARGLIQGLEARLEATGEVDRLNQEGELLKANVAALRRGMKRIEVQDFFASDLPMRVIELDPRLSPQENYERRFERALKLARSRATVELELGIARSREAELAALLERTRDPATDPASLEEEALGSGLLEKRQAAPARTRKDPPSRLPYRSFVAARGSEIRVGRSAKDNDDLTFRHAKGSDLWLHTADAPGSHVVLVLAKGVDPDSEELVDAAHLAGHFSPLRGQLRVRVHVARRKEVHKPRGAKAGLVQLSGGRILDLRVQPERLRRLLGQRGPANPADTGNPGRPG